MKTLTHKEAFGRGRSKWPQLKLTGKPVTVEQAKDIICRTDSFIGWMSQYGGGNNRPWNEWAHATMHMTPIFELDKHMFGEHEIEGFTQFYYEVRDEIRKQLNFVSTEYVNNSWLSCSYVYGPHGWCSPTGQLCFVDNVGKWPSVKEVFEDLVTIAEAFPYVEMTATLMNAEHCEDVIQPVVTFIVKDGKVVMTDEHDAHHFEVTPPDRSDEAMVKRLMGGYEQGVPDSWIEEFGAKFEPVMKAAHQKLVKFIEESKCKST